MTQLVKLTELDRISEGLESFEQRKAELTELAESAKGFDINSIADKEAFKYLVEKRKELKEARVKVEKEGKSMRDLITPVSKMISAKEKELVSIISPEEDRLQSREDWFKAETEKVRIEAETAQKLIIQKRIDALSSFGVAIDYIEVLGMDDLKFDEVLLKAKADFQAEQERIAKEKADADVARLAEEQRIADEKEAMRVESERLENIRIEQKAAQDKIDADLHEIELEKARIEHEKQAAIDAENNRIQEIENRIERANEIEAAKKQAAEKAIRDQKEKQERERIAAERKAAKQPDLIKALNVVKSLTISYDPSVAIKDQELNNIISEFIVEADGIMKKYISIIEATK